MIEAILGLVLLNTVALGVGLIYLKRRNDLQMKVVELLLDVQEKSLDTLQKIVLNNIDEEGSA